MTSGAEPIGAGLTITAAPNSYEGSIENTPAEAKMRNVEVSEEIISVLAGDPYAMLKNTMEINAEFRSALPIRSSEP